MENPNERGFLSDGLFVDLDRVVMVDRRQEPGYQRYVTRVWFDHTGTNSIVAEFDEDEHASLCKALLVYRSGR